MRKFALLAATALSLAATATATAAAAAADTAAVPAAAKPAYGDFGVDTAGMNRAVKPGDDFAEFVNGTYQKNLVIPADRSIYGMFNKLRDLSQERTRGIVEAAAANTGAPAGSDAAKVGDYYASFMDAAAIDAKGAAPVKPQLDAVAAIASKAQLAAAFGVANRLGIVDADHCSVSSPDRKNPDAR